MFGPKISTVFASRWKAVWWSAAILMTAYCSIPGADDGPGGPPDAAAQAQAEQALKALDSFGTDHASAHQGRSNPWSKQDK
jgi:hypothetical protein